MNLDPDMLKLLVCPACRGVLTEAENSLNCPICAVNYPVRDGIPIMLVEEAVSTIKES